MSVDKRPDRPKPWRARVATYPGGPEITKHFVRKVDAQRWEREQILRIEQGTYLSPEQQRITLSTYRSQYIARQMWRPRTVDLSTRALERCERILGKDRPLTSVKRSDVEALVKQLSDTLAPSTVRQTFQHFRSLMRSAVADGLVIIDPTVRIRLPAPPSNELIVPNPETVRALMEAATPMMSTAIMLGAHVGLRAGEVQGLRSADVDFLRRTVSVRVQLGRIGKGFELCELKTRASQRIIPVPQSVIDVVASHIARNGTGPDGVLIHHRDGYMHDNAFNWQWRLAQRGAGLKEGSLRFHSLRHAFASSLISSGCSVKAVADSMGHQSPSITLNTYASLWPGDEDRIRSAIESAWNAPDQSRTRGDQEVL